MSRLNRILNGVFILTAAAWFGGIVALVMILPALFGSTEITRTQAALLAGNILLRFDRVALGLLPVLCVAGLATRVAARASGKAAAATLLFLLVVSASKLSGVFVLRPAMDTLQAAIPSFERSAPSTPSRDRFNQLHHVAEALMGVDLVALGVLLVLPAGAARRRDASAPGGNA